MSESIIRKTMTRGVGRRILGLFLLAAIAPMLFTSGLAFYEINRGLEQEAAKSLKGSAKEYGVEILTRLELATEKAAQVVRIVEEEGIYAIAEHEYLLSDFEAVWVVGEEGPPTISLGSVSSDVSFSMANVGHLPVGETRLLLTSQNQIVMVRSVADGSGTGPVVAFQLVDSRIWGPREYLPFNTEFCVFSEAGISLYCTSTIDAAIHSSLVLDDADNRGSIFGRWTHEGEAHFAALWQLFLKGAYNAPAFDIVAIQPKAIAMQSGTDFTRVFIPAIVLVLILVGILSLNVIGRSLVPLQNLTIAARQVAGGNLDSRVRVRTGDEFEWLAEAFNNMADRIGHQISALEAMSGIDRMILSGTKLEEVSEDVVAHLIGLTQCESAAVIARDVEAPEVGMMISLHDSVVHHDRIELPEDVGHEWCQPRQVALDELHSTAAAPYADRFNSFGQNYVVLIPVVLNDDLKGVLLLGFSKRFDMARNSLQRVIDLAGRFAVALASVEREDALYRQAHFDQLTGLPNRQLLKDRLTKYLATARTDNHSGAILFLDLDRFKEINDVFGHSVGDGVLSQTSERIMSEVRERDTVARLGGDEFVVVLPNVRNNRIVRATAERLLDQLSEAFTVSGTDHYLSASIGIAMFPDDGTAVETLLKNADAAMYRAKDAGRGRFEFFNKRLNAESRRKIGIERDLRIAFHSGDLNVQYQPQFDIKTGIISGAEALLRWTHAEQGPISPAEFIPLAEDSELIVDIGSWVIEKACEDLCGILDKGLHPGPISINVSGRQLADSCFAKTVMEPIRKFGIHPGYIQLEVTETTVAQNRDKAIAILQSLREQGVRIAIDDFGTGYSSLSYLQQMPFDVIKIDKSFIDRIGSSVASDNICRTIIKMAEQLGKTSIAEGVEEQSQMDFLRKSGCNFVQGFYYSTALPRDEFLKFIEKQDFHTQRRKALEII
jgi:diguanylate cyclase (GGDEF)-like protein